MKLKSDRHAASRAAKRSIEDVSTDSHLRLPSRVGYPSLTCRCPHPETVTDDSEELMGEKQKDYRPQHPFDCHRDYERQHQPGSDQQVNLIQKIEEQSGDAH